jgi:two-component system sensor histidine kinase ArlS
LSILLDNAIKYTQRPCEVKVRTWHDVVNGVVVLSVQDDGIGISPEAMPRIFDRFFRADAARRNGLSVGSGLGLSIAKWIVEAHSGSIHAGSEFHCGSSFSVSLPASEEYGSNHK